MEVTRMEISSQLRACHKKADIVKKVNVWRMTVYWVADRMTESETLEDRLRSGRPNVIDPKKRKSSEITRLSRWILLAKKKIDSVTTVSKIWLGRSLRRLKTLLITIVMQQKRKECSQMPPNNLKSHGYRIVIFSEVKVFNIDPMLTKQRDRDVVFRKNFSEI